MNAWGWYACITHRKEIIEWFVGQAANHNVKISSGDAVGLFKAGIALALKQRIGK